MKKITCFLCTVYCLLFLPAHADSGDFDMDRWNLMLGRIQETAVAKGISADTINATIQPASFIPSIVQKDKNQAEFKLTLSQYLTRAVNPLRIVNGKKVAKEYPTLLGRTKDKFKIQPHVIMAFWGMESNYGTFKSAYKLTDAFLTLIYDGRRETFFTNQLFALMKIADQNGLKIEDIHGSWAGAMGHFQFIPTTLAQYGMDGNGDGKIDIINSISDAMFSAGNYLSQLGWKADERIVREIALPDDFDFGFCDAKTKMTLSEWGAKYIITNPDGTPAPTGDMIAGVVCDVTEFEQFLENENRAAYGVKRPRAFFTYPNFYRIKKWNNSNWYAVAIAMLADELR